MANSWEDLGRAAEGRVLGGQMEHASQRDWELMNFYQLARVIRETIATHTTGEAKGRAEAVQETVAAVTKAVETIVEKNNANTTKKTIGIAGGISTVVIGIIEGARAGFSHIRF